MSKIEKYMFTVQRSLVELLCTLDFWTPLRPRNIGMPPTDFWTVLEVINEAIFSIKNSSRYFHEVMSCDLYSCYHRLPNFVLHEGTTFHKWNKNISSITMATKINFIVFW